MIFISFFLKIMLESKFGSPINSFLSILFDFVLIEVLPTSFFDLNISNSQCAECQFSTIADNACVYETFGISKYFPVKLQLLLIRAEMLDNPLTAKCFIHVVSVSLFIYLVIFLSFLLHWLSVRWQDILFCNFWLWVSLCELQMCMTFSVGICVISI